MNQKRMLHDKIDIFFLLNQKQIVTKTELNNLLPLQNYEEYQISYYKRKLSDIFMKNYSCDWFFDHYLSGPRDLKFHRFDINGEYLIIYSVSNFHTKEDLHRILSEIDGYVEFTLFQPDLTKGFRRDCYVKMQGADIESKYEEIRVKLNDFKIEFGCVRIDVEENLTPSSVDLQEVMSITKSICELYGVSLEEVMEIHNAESSLRDDTKPEYFLSILKNIFLYNYTTSQQFYSPLEFYVKRNSTTGDAERRRELVLNYRSLSPIKSIPIDLLLGRTLDKVEENVYMCLFCEKKFETEEYVLQHHKKKHQEDLEGRKVKYGDFSRFVDSVDIFILNLAEGSFDENPWFIKKRDERSVVYDMNHVFSGDISINKR